MNETDLEVFNGFALTLENDSKFYYDYLSYSGCNRADARDQIARAMKRLGLRLDNIEAVEIEDILPETILEYLRRYLDARYNIVRGDENDEYATTLAPVVLARSYPECGRAYWRKLAAAQSKQPTQPNQPNQLTKEETIMTTQTTAFFATKFLLNGNDLSVLSDAAIYAAIAKKGADIKALEAIEPKPARLVKQINEAKTELAGFIAFLDARDAETGSAAPTA